MNQLRAYLAQNSIRQSVLAETLGVSNGYMSQIINGDKRPSLDLAVKIEDATGGAVTARSWVAPLPAPDAPSEKDVA